MTNVYFIPGMGAGCKVFDRLELPDQYQKIYLEWRLPNADETLDDYAKSYALKINKAEPFVLVGYSFGGILVQEMNKYLVPEKTILLASIKDTKQRPDNFSFFKKIHVEKAMKPWLFNEKLISWIFTHFVYKTKEKVNMKDFLPQLNASYMRWAIKEILNWKPTILIDNLYQIHGTKDLTFPYRKIKNNSDQKLYTIKGSGHLLVLEKPIEVSRTLMEILQK
ncbi:MAG: alpha/beta hydrolase [Pseudopedobacter saltans]|uniref:Alpha/beta hydrolase n=1 Tax=Pseudopedobacter saltans TaxID=151895 RepID=A0A2W5F9J9_9SPHI|nr:MAG: alpha/beta hydrolase [Pseudopedobacter saltans]